MIKKQLTIREGRDNDPYQRFKMPAMVVRVEGKGGSTRTNIINLAEVAKALDTDPEYIIRFMGYQLGSQTYFQRETGKTGFSAYIKGEFSEARLLKTLYQFIKKYVLCPRCDYPDMYMVVKNDRVRGVCRACGLNQQLDNQHKVASIIRKHPPSKDRRGIWEKEQKDIPIQMKSDSTVPGKSMNKNREHLHEDQLKLQDSTISGLLQELKILFNELKEQKKEAYMVSAELTQKIRSFKIDSKLTDRLGYLIFQTLFTVNITKQLKQYAELYLELLEKFKIDANSNTLLNLEYLLLELHKGQDLVMMNISHNLLTEEFLLEWGDHKSTKTIKSNFLFSEERDYAFRKLCSQLIQTLKQDSQQEAQ